MRTLVVGCNHRTASLAVRERLAFGGGGVAALRELARRYPGCEGLLLSTCNRTELYLARPVHDPPRIDEAIAFLTDGRGLTAGELRHAIYHYEDVEALRHLFRVASSLDSMVLGETQIIGQTRDAIAAARRAGTLGRHLHAVFQRALAAAKDVHARTGISAGHVSVGSTAIDFARQVLRRVDDKTVLMIGAGAIGEATLAYLLEAGPACVLIANRTRSRAAAVCRRIARRCPTPSRIVAFETLADSLVEADIVISSTGSPQPILTRGCLADLPRRRAGRPLLMIDVAVPRDVEPAVGRLHNVHLYNVDDLQAAAAARAATRLREVDRCRTILEEHVAACDAWLRSRDVGPTIEALHRRIGAIGEAELARLLPKLSSLSPRDRALLEQMLHRVTRKLMHGPATALRAKAATGHARTYVELLRRLFDLHPEE